MRWCVCVLLSACVALGEPADHAPPAPPPPLRDVVPAVPALPRVRDAVVAHNVSGSQATNESQVTFTVSAVSFGEGGTGGAALAALLRGALAQRGVKARAVPSPTECASPAPPDTRACLESVLAALARGALHAALVPAARALSAPQLLDAGLQELADAAPPAHRNCWATPAGPLAPPLRTLLDLVDVRLATAYRVPRADIDAALRELTIGESPRYYCGTNSTRTSEPTEECASEDEPYATLLVGDKAEAVLMRDVVHEHALRAHVVSLPTPALRVVATLAPRAMLLCGRALDPTALRQLTAHALSPPPCLRANCPFEARRLVKLVNARVLAHAPLARRMLGNIVLDETELAILESRARTAGPEVAVREALTAHPSWVGAAGEVRAAVMIPATTRREVFDAAALRAAAELAEVDEAREQVVARHAHHSFDFKVELLDDACSGPRAFKYLTDALGSEFGALSGIVGPGCGAAFGDVTRQSVGLTLPVLAYTVQTPPSTDKAWLSLLAAGDARTQTAAWAELLARLHWRRVAVLSELATRTALEPAHLGADVIVHVEMSEDSDRLNEDLIVQWTSRVADANGRILLVWVEDARVARAALCAGRGAGLTPTAGAVWLLGGALPERWLHPAADDSHNCTREQLEEVAEGHLSLAPEWAVRWEATRGEAAPAEWSARWRERCRRAHGAACAAPPSHAALLYDALRLWAAALARRLAVDPAALDDLHREDFVRSLMEDAVQAPFVGLTGAFEWQASASGSTARTSPPVLRQWRNGSHVPLAEGEAPRWLTADGRAPDDGADGCVLQALADALHGDCRAAFAAAGALLLAAAAALLAAAAWHCRRRAEREYRARLAALGMRTLGPKPGGLDRWEVPRQRVVINRKLGMGAFGTVYGGHALLAEDRGWSAVAVKTLKAGASTEDKLDFLSEAEAMKRFDHKNVVRLLGVVTKTEPVCTVMEFMLYGDLKNYLLARRHLVGASGMAGEEVAPARLTAMALDAARALSYLAQLRYVHRDIAARNCLVSANRVVKLADFGMTRLVFESDYYRFSRKGMLPVRWMAPESLALGVFSPASDVWSFGVLLYEIVTFGSLPFQGLSNAEVLARVKAGGTLDLPPGLKPQLEGLIKSCWQQESRARPGAAAVAAFMSESPRLLAPCLDVPLDALTLDDAPAARDRAEARWVSWAAPTSTATDSTYLSADATPGETDAFLPPAAAPP